MSKESLDIGNEATVDPLESSHEKGPKKMLDWADFRDVKRSEAEKLVEANQAVVEGKLKELQASAPDGYTIAIATVQRDLNGKDILFHAGGFKSMSHNLDRGYKFPLVFRAQSLSPVPPFIQTF